MANERWDSDSKTLLTTVNANSNGDSGRCDSPNRNSGATGIMLMQTNRNWTNGNHEDHEQHDSIPNENENETLQKSEHTTTAVVTATPVRNMVLLTSSSSQTTSSSSPSPLLALSPFKRKRFMVDNSTQFSLDMSLKPFTSQQIAQARNNNPQHYARYHTHTHTYTQLTSNDNKNSTILSDHHPLATSRAPVPLVGSSPSSSLTLSSPSQSFAIASVSSVEFLSPSMSSISASVNAMMSTPRSYCSADNDGNSTGTVYGSGRRATTPHQQSHQSISAASSMMTTGSTATEVDTIQYHQQKSASSAYSWKATSSIAKCDSAHFQISNGKGLMAPSTSMDQQQFRLHHQPLSAAVPYVGTGGSFVQVPSTPMWLHSSALTTSQGSDSIASAIAASPQPPYSELHWPQTTLTATSPSSGGSTIEYTLLPSTSEQFVLSEIHSGVIMASPGPALSSSSLSEVRRSSLANTTTPTSTMATSFGHHRLSDFVRALFSQSLVSRLYARRPHFFSVGSQSTPVSSTLLSSVNSWTIIRVVNTCHLLYLIPVTSVSIARLVTIEMICNEQLFSWLTVQSFLFMSQILCACYSLQRQTISSRMAMLDQRSRILLLVCMIWAFIGVGFLSADNNNGDSSCSRANDPIYSLSFKIIIFHLSLLVLCFMPCTSYLLTRILPDSFASGLSRTATKPMIEKLGAVPMTEGMFGSDPEEATCAICLGNYVLDETIRVLPCQHHFHLECVDQWLFTDKSCPLCKHDIDKPILNSFRRNSDLMTQSSGINNININIHHSNNSPSMDRIQIIIA